MKLQASLFTLILCVSFLGCAEFRARNPPPRYENVVASKREHTRVAVRQNRVGLELYAEGNWGGAEDAFHRALIADSGFGPAHNNLGKLYFDQGDNYLAAREYDLAARAMPKSPQPLNNIGLIYQKVGEFDEAIEYFSRAHALCPSNPEYLGNLVKARISRGDGTSDVRDQLGQLRLIENRPQWEDWAAEQLEFGGLDRPYLSEAITIHLGDVTEAEEFVDSSDIAPHLPHAVHGSSGGGMGDDVITPNRPGEQMLDQLHQGLPPSNVPETYAPTPSL